MDLGEVIFILIVIVTVTLISIIVTGLILNWPTVKIC